MKALIDPVNLELQKNTVKFLFQDDNVELETTEIVRIINNGNAPGKFKWTLSDRKIFTVFPEEGVVQNGSFLDLKIVYKPT